MKKGKIITAIAVVCLSVFSAYMSQSKNINADETNSVHKMTVGDYKNYLKNYSVQDAKNAGVSPQFIDSSVKGASERLNKFNNLSNSDQQSIVNNLNNPKSLEDKIQDKTDVNEQKNLSLNSLGSLPTRSVKASDTSSLTLKNGIDLMKVRSYVKFRAQGGAILKIIDTDSYVTENYVPFLNTEKNGSSSHVTRDNLAYSWVRWEYYLGVGSVSIQPGNINFSIWVNSQGEIYRHRSF